MKAEFRKVKLKNKMLKRQEQENLSRIEEEVSQSLAKAMSSSNIHKNNKRQSPYTINRSYNSINLHQGSTVSFAAANQIMNKSNSSQFHTSLPVKKSDYGQQVLNDITADILNRQVPPTRESENEEAPYTFT